MHTPRMRAPRMSQRIAGVVIVSGARPPGLCRRQRRAQADVAPRASLRVKLQRHTQWPREPPCCLEARAGVGETRLSVAVDAQRRRPLILKVYFNRARAHTSALPCPNGPKKTKYSILLWPAGDWRQEGPNNLLQEPAPGDVHVRARAVQQVQPARFIQSSQANGIFPVQLGLARTVGEGRC